MPKRTLIMTLPPVPVGGVSAKARLLAEHLGAAGHEVTIAYYLASGLASTGASPFDAMRSVGVPCRRPWLEQNYTADSKIWRRLIDDHDRHVAVGGTVLIANPLAAAGVRHLVWCAADLEGDRVFRHDAMPWWRRLVDRAVVAPALRRQQAVVLNGDNRIYGVSGDTVARLSSLAPGRDQKFGRLPIPIETDFLTPGEAPSVPFRIGFAGRLDDPRKNAALLFDTLAAVRAKGLDVTLAVTGAEDDRSLAAAMRAGVRDHVTFSGILDRPGLREFYRTLSVYVISSHQEGLGIAALEAMACGVPVVSTRCGGPEDFVADGETGRLCDADAGSMSAAVCDLLGDSARRERMARQARQQVLDRFGMAGFRENLAGAWRATWNEAL